MKLHFLPRPLGGFSVGKSRRDFLPNSRLSSADTARSAVASHRLPGNGDTWTGSASACTQAPPQKGFRAVFRALALSLLMLSGGAGAAARPVHQADGGETRDDAALVVVMEPDAGEQEHSLMVAEVYMDYGGGTVSRQDVAFFAYDEQFESRYLDKESLDRYISETYGDDAKGRYVRAAVQDYYGMAEQLERAAELYPDARIINASFGISPYNYIRSAQIVGDRDVDRQAIVDEVYETLRTDPELLKAQAFYEEMTRKLAERGIFVMVAVGNAGEKGMSGMEKALNIDLPDDAGFNFYARSDAVLGIAGFDWNETPADPADDVYWPKSSIGTGEYNPFLAGPAQDVPLTMPDGGTESFGGTSSATPYVGALIHEMRSINPELTDEQVLAILTASCIEHDDLPDTHEGAGFIDREKALAYATGELPLPGSEV